MGFRLARKQLEEPRYEKALIGIYWVTSWCSCCAGPPPALFLKETRLLNMIPTLKPSHEFPLAGHFLSACTRHTSFRPLGGGHVKSACTLPGLFWPVRRPSS